MAIFSKLYVASANVAPSTTAADTVYVALGNPSGSGVALKVLDIAPQAIFAGTNAATRSFLAVQKVIGAATGGTAITPTDVNNSGSTSLADLRSAAAGLTITPGTANRFFFFSVPSQNTSVVSARRPFSEDNPLVLAPGEALLVVAHIVQVVLGVSFSFNLLWAEEA